MTDPNTPGAAITRAAARHKASIEATKNLAQTLANERQAPPESEPQATTTPRP